MHLYQNHRALTRNRLHLMAAALLLAAGLGAQGQTITNPSFEADTFTVAPGNVTANGPITGWSATSGDRAGLNPVNGTNLIANNGFVPSGTKVAFLRSTNVFSTTITGLTPATSYMVKFRVNSQTSTTPKLRVAIDDSNLFDAGSVVSVGANPYYFVALPFVATAASHVLNITNDAAGLTHFLLLDDFSVSVNTSGWSMAPWSNDATIDVDSSRTYTHAYAFNTSGAQFAINGVNFTRIANGGPQVPLELSTVGIGSVAADAGNVPRTSGGGGATLASQFVFGGTPAQFELHNLVPGLEYVATIYSVGWDPREYGRAVTFSCGNDKLTVNQDFYGNDAGIRVNYRYIAPASGSISFSNIPFSTAVGTYHTYGLANYAVVAQTTPVIGVNPASKASVPGAGVGFVGTAGGARPLSYRWLKDGVEIPGATTRVLSLSNLTDVALGQYSLWVSNSFGMITSAPATLTFSTANFANPSFEQDTFFQWPGYVSGNAAINGWLTFPYQRTGINPLFDGVGPFANNGTVPDGAQVGFLQSANPGSTILATLINNLLPGTNYTLQFRANARNGQKPNLHIGINSNHVVNAYFSSVATTNAYRFISVDFTAPNTNVVLTLTNDIIGDHTLLVDAFSVAPSNSQWSVAQWVNDATAGIDTTKLYTHAYYFGGSTAETNVNGVVFRGAPGANPSIPGFLGMSGFGSIFNNDVNAITLAGGASAGIAANFIYGGPVHSITFSNLLPGTEYVASVYCVGFDTGTNGRTATFNVGTDRRTIDLNRYGNDQGVIVSYRYIASPNGTFTLTYTPTDAATTFHTYAAANRVAVDSAPVIGAQPISQFVAIGTSANFAVGLSAGSLPIHYQWQLNGVDIPDATNSTFTASNLNAYGITSYQVIVTNILGATTSIVATVEVGAPFSELFSTGVDAAGAALPGGQIDPHYALTSPDTNFPGPQAIVMYDNVFPVVGGTYLTNGLNAQSAWISSATNTVAGAEGLYRYRTTFVIDTVDITHAQITGLWASDNDGVAVLLNGAYTGVSNVSARTFGSFVGFVITNGFVTGSNTLEFVVTNLAVGYTGLRAELKGVGRPLTNTPPQIIAQPASRTVGELSDVSFTVQAIGSGPLLYQWYQDGIDLPGQTNRTMVLTDVSQIDQSGSYYVTVSNEFGSTNSATAQLTIIIPPSIDALDGQTQTLECGSTSFMAVYALGEEPLVYQWYFGSTPVLGATNYDFYITNVTSLNAGLYKVVITNGGGSVTSAPLSLTVQDTVAPFIVTCATNMSITANASCQAVVPNLLSQIVATDCNSLSITQSPAPGTVLSFGTHTITFTVTDAANNVTNCQSTFSVVAAVPNVPLFIQADGNNAVITWPTTAATCWQLYQTGDLTPPRTWSPVTNAVTTVGTNFSVTVSSSLTNRFFRLQGP